MFVREKLAPFVGGALGVSGLAVLGVIAASLWDQQSSPITTIKNNGAVNLSLALDGITTIALQEEIEVFVPPSDSRERLYNAFRLEAHGLSDAEVLARFSNSWADFKVIKERNDGRALAIPTANDIAAPMHAIWREILQRGLTLPPDTPDFNSAWRYLLSESAG